MASCVRSFILQPLGEQNPLDDIQLLILPRLQVLGQVNFQQETIDKFQIFFVGQVRLNDRLEEFGVFLEQEERQFVAGVF